MENQPGENVLDGSSSVVVSPDNKGLYVVTRLSDTLVVFHRNTFTGMPRRLEVHRDNVGGVDGLETAFVVAASADNENVYVASNDDSAVSVFGRVGAFPDTHLVFLPLVVR